MYVGELAAGAGVHQVASLPVSLAAADARSRVQVTLRRDGTVVIAYDGPSPSRSRAGQASPSAR